MASLTREDLRMELQRADLVTEATMRTAFREELGGILTFLHQALGTETCRVSDQPADVDAAKRSPTLATSDTVEAQVHSHGPTDRFDRNASFAVRRHTLGSGKGADMVQEYLEQISEYSVISERVNPSKSDKAMPQQSSTGSFTPQVTPDEFSDLAAPSQTHPPTATPSAVVLPGELHAGLDAVVPNLGNKISNSDRQVYEALPSPRSVSQRRISDSSFSRRTVEKHNERVRTSEDRTVQTSKITLRRWAARMVGHSIFDYIVTVFIMLNSVSVGIQTDHMAQELTEVTPIAFQVLEFIFCGVFTIELCLRLCTYGTKFLTMSGKGWNLFDLFVVTAQILEISMEFVASGTGYSFNSLRVLRGLRLIRVVRLARALRLIDELRTRVSSIAGSLKPLFWTGILLIMVMYVLGVYLTQVVLSRRIAHRDDDERALPDLELYWGSLSKSIMSLYQSITGGIDWDQVARPLAEHVSPELGILFSMYIGFTVLCMLNVVTGVFIESVMKNARSENELLAMNRVMQLFAKLDVHHTGEITWEDFHRNLDKKEMQEFFKTIDVEIGNARTLFDLLDLDSSGSVDVLEFMDGCLGMWAPARGLDLRIILRDVNRIMSLLLEENSTAAKNSNLANCVLVAE